MIPKVSRRAIWSSSTIASILSRLRFLNASVNL